MPGEDAHREASANDHEAFRPGQDVEIKQFQRGKYRWEYRGDGLDESFRLQHPEAEKTLAFIERNDHRKGYFDGNVELSLRNFEREIFCVRYYEISLHEALARAERHADNYLRHERARPSGLGRSNGRPREGRSSGDRER
jgi:hypothetical protein